MTASTGRLLGKRALVTGAAQGLGAATAEGLAREGARVLLTDVNGEGAVTVAAALNAKYGADTAYALRHDVASEADWVLAIEHARTVLGGLSVLVNNAGVVIVGSVEDLELTEWRRGMSINADSVFLGCKHALPLLRETQPASIINVSSISAMVASHNLANYNASKAAVWQLTKSVALHCAKNGWDIRCNSLHPTFIRTPMLEVLTRHHNADSAAMLSKLARQVPLQRIGEPEDVASAVVYLASDESRFMTASELKLDGGVSAM